MGIVEYLTELNNVSALVRLVFAMICGGIIGIERGNRKQAAGFRTHILVCFGSTLAAITNIYISQRYGGDATRISAQVVSGIGFLGVGTIIVTGKKQIRGLTTAAGLWTSACLGLTIGAGYYIPAIVSCILILVIMTVFSKIERVLYHMSKVIDIYVEFSDIKYVAQFLAELQSREIKAVSLEITKSKVIGETEISLLVTLHLPFRRDHAELLSEISELDGVNFIEET